MKNAGNQNAATWTAERIDRLKSLWSAGLSASQVAAELGGGSTRCGVIGKVHRLKLPPRSTIISLPVGGARKGAGRPRGSKSYPEAREYLLAENKRRKLPTPPSFEPEPFDMEDGEGVDVTARIGLVEASDTNGCMWVHGDPLLPNHSFCGKARKGKTSWCPEHYARVYPGAAS